MFDYCLVYRTSTQVGEIGEWKIAYDMENRRNYSFLWNPKKKFLKSFIDLEIDLLKFCDKVKDQHQISLSLPYLYILNYIDSLVQDSKVETIQFMILCKSELYDYERLFLSDAHPLSKKSKK